MEQPAEAQEPTQDDVAAFLEVFLKTADLTAITMKIIRTRVKEELQAEQGKHYEKAWMMAEVDRIMRARQAAEAAEAAEAANTEPGAEAAAADSAEPEATAPAEPAAAASVAPPRPGYAPGTVLWAKMRGYPYWPALVWAEKANKKADYLREGGWHFVKFFGARTGLAWRMAALH